MNDRGIMQNVEGKKRPTAWGHRFGPDLQCSECGLSWDAHQSDPQQCSRREELSVVSEDVEVCESKFAAVEDESEL